MSLILIIGDSFHLLPRIRLILSKGNLNLDEALGRGKQITSITMAVFYLLLFHLGLAYYNKEVALTVVFLVYIAAAIRIYLCLLEENKWEDEKGSDKMAIGRNIPFIIQGYLVFRTFFQERELSLGMGMVWWGIGLSFIFYIPVVLWVKKKPKLGMLMLPKSLAYIWILIMCLYM